uniref:Uncharacterized protein n=1 Tax=Rhizophora mucronata TaxID=61149 RepID=A0A2P2IXI9_RHIMU
MPSCNDKATFNFQTSQPFRKPALMSLKFITIIRRRDK